MPKAETMANSSIIFEEVNHMRAWNCGTEWERGWALSWPLHSQKNLHFRRQVHCMSWEGGKLIKKEQVKRETQRTLIKIKVLRTKLVTKPKDTKRRKMQLPNHQHQEPDNRWEGWELHNYEQHDNFTEPGTISMSKRIARIRTGSATMLLSNSVSSTTNLRVASIKK